MQQVVLLFLGILTLVRASPFDLDGVNRPTLFRHPFRVEKATFGNDDLLEYFAHEDDYEIGSFDSEKNAKFIIESDEGKSIKALADLFSDLDQCNILTMAPPPQGGCIYVANGNAYLFRILSTIDIEDVNAAFSEAGIEECEVGENGSNKVPIVGCFRIDTNYESIYWFGVYDDEVSYVGDKTVEEIKNLFKTVEKCDLSDPHIPEEGCALFDEIGIHYINVLNDDNLDEFEKALIILDIPECVYDEDVGLISKEPCYLIASLMMTNIHFLNLHLKKEGVQDDDEIDHYIEKTYQNADAKVAPPPLFVQTEAYSVNLQQLELKGIFNHPSSVVRKTKAVVPKKIQSSKQTQEVQKKVGRRG